MAVKQLILERFDHAKNAAAAAAAAAQLGALFASVKDKHLLQLGVPEELLPVVRSMNTDADMERAESAIRDGQARALAGLV